MAREFHCGTMEIHLSKAVATLSTGETCLGEVSLDSQSIPCLGGRSVSTQNRCEREYVVCGDILPGKSVRLSRGRHHAGRTLSPMCCLAESPGPASRYRRTCGFAFCRYTSRLREDYLPFC